MDQTPKFLTNYALTRLLKEFALRLGLDDMMADVVAQIHVQQTELPTQWSEFMAKNCTFCQKSPASCDFLNPNERNCMEGTTPEKLRSANATMVERGRFSACPSFTPSEA